jgi:hypothetical protein
MTYLAAMLVTRRLTELHKILAIGNNNHRFPSSNIKRVYPLAIAIHLSELVPKNLNVLRWLHTMDIAPVTGKVAEADWVRFKETIRELYLVQNKPLLGNTSVQQEMKERFNFCQT